MAFFRQLATDAIELARAERHIRARDSIASDSFAVLALFRARQIRRRWRIPGASHALRLATTMVYAIEIDNEVTLGDGVSFVHTLGTVIGGSTRVGFMGNNTVGTAKENGYPVLEDDVVVGAGACILGPVRVGARAVIGANAVVVHDVLAGAVVAGVPAREH